MDSRNGIRKLQRMLAKSKMFYTLNGFRNYTVKFSKHGISFKSARTGNVQRIPYSNLKRAIDYTLNKRVIKRKDMEHFTNMHSALLGLLAMLFKGKSNIDKMQNGTLRLILSGLRFFFGGLCRTEKDMKTVSENGGRFACLSYYNIRSQRQEQWLQRLRKYNIKAIIDSGAYSKHRDKVNIHDYLAFIKKYKDDPHILGFIAFDKIGDPIETKRNLALMENLGANVIPVWQITDSYESLDQMVAKGYDLICIGGTVPLSKRLKYNELRSLFNEVFKRHPHQPFHMLGSANPLMLEYPFFSADATSYLRARWFGKKDIYLPNAETVKTPDLSVDECVSQKIKFLQGLEFQCSKIHQLGYTFYGSCSEVDQEKQSK